jgi:hypothetical protein
MSQQEEGLAGARNKDCVGSVVQNHAIWGLQAR